MNALRALGRDPRLAVAAALIVILLVGAALRTYRLPELLVLGTDQSRDALVVNRMMLTGQPVLEGPIASLGTYRRGPAYYYLLAPAYWLSGGHPIGGFLLTIIFDLAAIAMAFVLVRSLAGSLAGLSAAGLWAVSPIMVDFGRFQWNPQLMPFFALLAVYAALRVARGDGRWLMVVVPAWLVAWQMHDPALLILPALAVLVLWRWRTWWRRETLIGTTILGVLVVLPYVVRQVANGGRDLIAIAGYVVGGLFGSGPPPEVASPLERVATALLGMRRGLPDPEIAGLAVIALAFVGTAWAVWRSRRGVTPESATILLLAASPLMFVFWRAPFHGHYLLLFYPLPLMLAAIGAAAIVRLKRDLLAPVAVVLVVGVMLVNSVAAVQEIAARDPSFRRWDNRLAVARQVIMHANDDPFALRIETDLEGRDSWEAPYQYAFVYAGTQPNYTRADLPTYVVFEPADHENAESYGGEEVDGVRWVRFAAPSTGESVVGPTWQFEGRGVGSIEATDGAPTVRLETTWPWDRIDAAQDVPLAGGRRYMVAFAYRSTGLTARPFVYLQVFSAENRLVATLPTGAGHHVPATGEWLIGSFIGQVPDDGVRGRLILRSRGAGNVWFRSVQVAEVIRDEAPW